jgi:hypothetical protein
MDVNGVRIDALLYDARVWLTPYDECAHLCGRIEHDSKRRFYDGEVVLTPGVVLAVGNVVFTRNTTYLVDYR